MKRLIKGGRVLNPATNLDKVCDVLIEDGHIRKIADSISDDEAEVILAEGYFVMPGLVDLHVHFRDPGQTEKEDLMTGPLAAARGGVTSVVAMPNTKPVADSVDVISYVNEKAKKAGKTHVYQAGCITKGMAGEELSDLQGMADAGVIAISEDGKSVMDSGLYREAMRFAADHNILVMAHCEDIRLVCGGVVNQGKVSEALGVLGISNAVENIIAARDIMLAEETGARLHLCHCSTKESVAFLRDAKKKGIRVSGEVCPHHFTLCDEDIVEGNTNYKMNPPLRTKEDVQALREGLRDGILEVISTDHAPHTRADKPDDFTKAAFGIVGLETSASLAYIELVETGILTPLQMVEKMSYHPAQILGIEAGDLSEQKRADITIFDPHTSYVIHAADFASKGRNTPFEGRKVNGQVVMTLLDGDVVYHR